MDQIDGLAQRIEGGENVRALAVPLPDTQLAALLGRALPARARQILFDIAGERKLRDAVPALAAGLADPSASARASAADALGKIGDRRAGPPMLDAIAAERDPGVRRAMLAALYATGGPESVPVLLSFLDHPDAGHRAFAARSLGGLGAREALPAIARRLAIEDAPFARQQLAEASARLGRLG